MNRRYTFLLVAVFVLLAGYIFITRDQPAPGSTAQTTPSPTPIPVFNFVSDDVTSLTISDKKNNQTVAITRSGDGWQMEQPKQGPAYADRVGSLLITLSHLEAGRTVPTPSDLGSFGLASPALEARVTLKDNTEHVLQLGDQNPDKSYYYALKGGDSTVYLIRSSIGEDLKRFVSQPPYTPTPTLTPLPTLTPSSTPTATPTGQTATPTPGPATSTPEAATPAPEAATATAPSSSGPSSDTTPAPPPTPTP